MYSADSVLSRVKQRSFAKYLAGLQHFIDPQEFMMNALKLTALTLAFAATAGVAQAQDILTIPDVTVSGSAAITTDYMFRGISQTGNDAAVQAGMTFGHKSGAYASVWGSSVSSGVNKDGSKIDLMLGYVTPLALTATLQPQLDIGIMRYAYSGSGVDVDFNEVYAKTTFADAVMKDDALTLGVAYSDEYFNESNQFFYLSAGYTAPITGTNFGVVLHVGYNNFDSSADMRNALGTTQMNDNDYIDYKIGATFGVQGLGAELSYIGSDLKKSECSSGLCEGRVVLSLSKAF